jgi:beta-N-acetylhexosaminidase
VATSASGGSLERMLGQMIVARFSGPEAPASLLARIQAGEVGGVILFGDNIVGGTATTRELTTTLQAAARQGHNPPLLIMTDQEGGEVKRLPGPPTVAPIDMTSSSAAYAQGAETGAMLGSAGINLDLAPVADVERAAGSFLGTRSFGSTPLLVARSACAFAAGLASEHVAFTLKHFPGLGRANGSTDLGPVSIDVSPDSLRTDYAAYRTCGGDSLAAVMVSSATYPQLTGPLPAVMSVATYQHELALAVPGHSPVTISDDLQSPAITSQIAPARSAINAGLDLLMYAQTDEGSAEAYDRLLAEAQEGLVNRGRIAAADRAIEALKSQLGD